MDPELYSLVLLSAVSMLSRGIRCLVHFSSERESEVIMSHDRLLTGSLANGMDHYA